MLVFEESESDSESTHWPHMLNCFVGCSARSLATYLFIAAQNASRSLGSEGLKEQNTAEQQRLMAKSEALQAKVKQLKSFLDLAVDDRVAMESEVTKQKKLEAKAKQEFTMLQESYLDTLDMYGGGTRCERASERNL